MNPTQTGYHEPHDVSDPLYKAVSNATRRRIIELLREQPLTTGELCKKFDNLSRFAVMQHLNVLKEAGVVYVQRTGRQRWNYLNGARLEELRRMWTPQPGRKEIGETQQQIECTLVLPARPAELFAQLTARISDWWSDSNRSLTLEPQPGGRLIESFEEPGDGRLLATVTTWRRNKELQLVGVLGLAAPLLSFVTLRFEPDDKGTRLQILHQFGGQVTEKLIESQRLVWKVRLEERLLPLVSVERQSSLS